MKCKFIVIYIKKIALSFPDTARPLSFASHENSFFVAQVFMKTKKPLRVPKEGFIKTLNKIYNFSQNKPLPANFIILSSKINKKNLVLEKTSYFLSYILL